MENTNVLNKATGSIHIRTNRYLSLIERKLSNLLLHNAYNTILSDEKHTIPVSDLLGLVGWEESRNILYVKEQLQSLVKTTFTFNILNKDKTKKWLCCSLLSSAEVTGGVCTYEYPSSLRTLLYRPKLYAKLDMLVSSKFKRASSLILWEFFKEQISTEKNKKSVLTDWIEIDSFRNDILQLKKEIPFSTVHRDHIKPQIEEINKESDISVKVMFKKFSRAIKFIRFEISRKVSYQPMLNIPYPVNTHDGAGGANPVIKKYAAIFARKNPDSYISIVQKKLENGETTIENLEARIRLAEDVRKEEEEAAKALNYNQSAHQDRLDLEEKEKKKRHEENKVILVGIPENLRASIEKDVIRDNPNWSKDSPIGKEAINSEVLKRYQSTND